MGFVGIAGQRIAVKGHGQIDQTNEIKGFRCLLGKRRTGDYGERIRIRKDLGESHNALVFLIAF